MNYTKNIRNDKICSLMYHDVYVNDKHESGFKANSGIYTISEIAFENQVRRILEALYKRGIDSKYVQFTFDDGGISFYSVIAPILEKFNLRGVFFIATAYIGQDGFMSEAQIKDLAQRGHIIGGHSHTHQMNMNLLPNEALLEDWEQCMCILRDKLGIRTNCASLPNGFCSNEMLKIISATGFTEIYTSEVFEKPRLCNGYTLYGRYGIRDTMSVDYVTGIVINKRIKTKIRIRKAVLSVAKKVLGKTYSSHRNHYILKTHDRGL